jgi:hypothetical protein
VLLVAAGWGKGFLLPPSPVTPSAVALAVQAILVGSALLQSRPLSCCYVDTEELTGGQQQTGERQRNEHHLVDRVLPRRNRPTRCTTQKVG